MYRLLCDSEIQTIPTAAPDYHYTTDISEETPFIGYGVPNEIKRRPVALDMIPEAMYLDLVRLREHTLDHSEPESTTEHRVLEWAGLDDRYDLPISQFFGFPLCTQGYYLEYCQNRHCPISYCGIKTVYSDGRVAEEMMGYPDNLDPIRVQPFAFLGIDVVEELRESYTQIRVHICWCCLTIYTYYECT
ncbi:hypothetical protein [Symmachiella macrocystis]|nr:hypothetical protein [Symmachiella macrocystis]